MSEYGITIQFVPPASSGSGSDDCTDPDYNSEDWVRLEQESWEDTSNRSSDFGDWLASTGQVVTLYNMMQLYDQFMSQCNEDGSFDLKIFVEKSRTDLNYTIETSNGTLTGPFKKNEDMDEFYRVGPSETSLVAPWPVLISYEWEGNTYDACGNYIPPPAIRLEDGVLVWDDPVFGLLHIKGIATLEHYVLNAPVRDDAVVGSGNTNFAVVIAIWLGGVDQLQVSPPDLSKGTCSGGYGSSTSVDPDDPDSDQSCGRRTIKVDACTGEVISDTVEAIACPEAEDE